VHGSRSCCSIDSAGAAAKVTTLAACWDAGRAGHQSSATPTQTSDLLIWQGFPFSGTLWPAFLGGGAAVEGIRPQIGQSDSCQQVRRAPSLARAPKTVALISPAKKLQFTTSTFQVPSFAVVRLMRDI
jgi:hypothetical protein